MPRILLKIVLFLAVALFTSQQAVPAFAEERATREECVEKCRMAASLVKEVGIEETVKRIMDPSGPFIWKDSYVFCFEIDSGIMLAHPQVPNLIGKMTKGVKDKNGKLLFVAYANVALSQGEGWVDYVWPRPGADHASPKTSYVYRVPGENLVMVAGIYVD